MTNRFYLYGTIILGVLTLILFLLLPPEVFAAELDYPDLKQSGIEIRPLDPEKASSSFVKMGIDAGKVGQGFAVPLGVAALILGVTCIAIGILVSARLVKAGFYALGGVVLVFLILGDVIFSINFLASIGSWVRSYF